MSRTIPSFYQTPMPLEQLRENIFRAKEVYRKESSARPVSEKLDALDDMHELAKTLRNSRIVTR